MNNQYTQKVVSSGIKGFDKILKGGLLPHNAYLIRGGPGTGKTTFGLHFLQAGLENDEQALFIGLSENSEKIKRNARKMGFDVDSMHYLDLTPDRNFFTEQQFSGVFEDADIEMDPLIEKIKNKMDQVEPDRIFVDSLTQFRFLTPSEYQFHKYALSLTSYLLEQAESVLLASEASAKYPDDDLQFLSDGVISLESNPDYRQLTVAKLRGSEF